MIEFSRKGEDTMFQEGGRYSVSGGGKIECYRNREDTVFQ